MSTENISDLVLVNRLKKGSKPALEELVLRYESKVYSLAMRYTKSQQDAEEVLQDVFMTLYKKAKCFEGKSAFSSWLYRITVNSALMKLRKRRQEKAVLLDDLAPTTKAEFYESAAEDILQSDSRSIQHETRAALESAIGRLPEEYQAVFVMRDVDGLSNEETSKILKISVAAVKSRLHRARLMLQKKLRRYYNDYTGREAMTDMGRVMLKAAN